MNKLDLWSKRSRAYHKKIQSYLRYVMNDHFILVALFLLGALAYYYAEWIKTVNQLTSVLMVIISAIGALLPFVGKIATFLKEADSQFLGVLEEEWRPYFRSAKYYSWVFPLACQLVFLGAIFPLLVETKQISIWNMLPMGLNLFALKGLDFTLQEAMFVYDVKNKRGLELGLYLASFICIALSLFSVDSVWALLILPLILILNFWLQKTYLTSMRAYRWDYLISQEEQRQQRVFQLFSLFVDVPALNKAAAKRRKSLDGLVRFLSGKQAKTYNYLFARAFVRNAHYVTYYVQMLVLAGLLSFVLPLNGLGLAVQIALLLMTYFQLASLGNHYQESIMVRQYGLSQDELLQALQTILIKLSLIQIVFLSLWNLFLHQSVLVLVGAVICAVVLILFIQLYLKYRFRKQGQYYNH